MKFVWVSSINRFRRTEGEVKKAKQSYEVLEIETDKYSLIYRFNSYEERIEQLTLGGHTAASQPTVENAPEPEGSVEPPPHPKAPAPSYTEFSVALDKAWDKLSLTHQLHFAALAMERARDEFEPKKVHIDATATIGAPLSHGPVDNGQPQEEAVA